MSKYIKKLVVIEAFKYRQGTNELNILAFIKCGDYNNLDCLPKNYLDPIKRKTLTLTPIQINTLEGTMNVSDGDYVIKGVNSEYYPCKPDIFEKTYEKLGDETAEKKIQSRSTSLD